MRGWRGSIFRTGRPKSGDGGYVCCLNFSACCGNPDATAPAIAMAKSTLKKPELSEARLRFNDRASLPLMQVRPGLTVTSCTLRHRQVLLQTALESVNELEQLLTGRTIQLLLIDRAVIIWIGSLKLCFDHRGVFLFV